MRTGTRGSTWNILEEQLFEAQIGAPVDRAQVVAVVEIAMVEELLAGAGEARHVVAAHQPGKRFLPVDGQPFQFFQKLPVQQRGGRHTLPTRPKPARLHP